MPSTTANSKAPIISDSALSIRHATLVNSDEERLLGGSRSGSQSPVLHTKRKLTLSRRNNDAGAVPIGKPQTRPFSQLSAVKVRLQLKRSLQITETARFLEEDQDQSILSTGTQSPPIHEQIKSQGQSLRQNSKIRCRQRLVGDAT